MPFRRLKERNDRSLWRWVKETGIQYPDFPVTGDFENQDLEQPEALETFRDPCTQPWGPNAARGARTREPRGPKRGLSFAGQSAWPLAGPGLLGGQDARCNLLEGMGWAGASPGAVGSLRFLLLHVFITHEAHEAQGSQLTWQEPRPELFPSLRKLGLGGFPLEQESRHGSLLPGSGAWSQPDGGPCSPPRERGVVGGPGATGSSSANDERRCLRGWWERWRQ